MDVTSPDSVSPGSSLPAAKQRAAAEVVALRERLLELSHTIHAHPELSWQEHAAAALIADTMRAAGFATEVGVYGVETAIEAIIGSGDLTVAICSEYDALPGIGHACGHNVIAASGVGAALALAPLADEAGLRIKFLGTPAEEHGGGKVAMLTAGAWEDVDFSMMVHGMSGVDIPAGDYSSTAVDRFEVIFEGRAAHAAAAPEQAVNAGAAATLALTAMGLLRQHLPAEANTNAFISFGGEATNIIPDRTVVQVESRANDIELWHTLKKRVLACFEGAAIATGCSWSWKPTEYAYAPVKPDPVLSELWDDNLRGLGRTIVRAPGGIAGGSTDMGNVTQVLPAIHPVIAFLGETAPPHSPAFTQAAITPAADQAILDAATAMAQTTLDVALDPQRRRAFKDLTAARPEGATRITLEA